jgi:hypothetical protein
MYLLTYIHTYVTTNSMYLPTYVPTYLCTYIIYVHSLVLSTYLCIVPAYLCTNVPYNGRFIALLIAAVGPFAQARDTAQQVEEEEHDVSNLRNVTVKRRKRGCVVVPKSIL